MNGRIMMGSRYSIVVVTIVIVAIVVLTNLGDTFKTDVEVKISKTNNVKDNVIMISEMKNS